MKNGFLLFIAVFLSVVTSAQKVYFLYLQSDDQSPFYVRIGDKIHGSAASGFLIVPNLTDSTYTFGLGFAKSATPESKFSVTINQDDKGYIIKNFEEGLALFDFRDLSIVKSASAAKDNTVYQTKTDNFSNILSKAAGDPKLLKVPVAKKVEPSKTETTEKNVITAKNEEKKSQEKPIESTSVSQPQIEPVQQSEVKETTLKEAVVKNDSSAVQEIAASTNTTVSNSSTEKKVEETTATEVKASAYRPSVIARHSESSTTEGFGMVFFDKTNAGVDTIRILIPASKVKLVSESANQPSSEIKSDIEKLDTPNEVQKEASIAATEIKSDNQANEIATCKNTASEKAFMKLRKKMAAEETDEEMIDEAKKEFRSKCFSVEQIRHLSGLFLTSAAKYQFFDAAFPFVSDRNNFSTLQSEIKDEYYVKRFKALIGE